MIPLEDESRRPNSFPIVTVLLILTNVIVFISELVGGDSFVMTWSVIPADITSGHHYITIITSTFMHASWSHIIGNMVFLWAFGVEIEDAMGPWRYLIFYLLGGIIANLAQIAAIPTSTIPNLGASGAIAAVMGAFLVTYPRDQILTVIFLGFFVRVTQISAALLIGVWFVIQVFSVGVVSGAQPGGGVAYLAHVGGFIFGAIFARLFEDRNRIENQSWRE
jgi:membrane associated rhomboid family serine protease